LTTVAEGVEHLDTCHWLASINIDQAQGYAIARPMTADEVLRWIDRWPRASLA
jgi:EAL domain-containing protein (putative c-di-GMP-specific phosphodiesterase class I)